jgi:hypothetical protein
MSRALRSLLAGCAIAASARCNTGAPPTTTSRAKLSRTATTPVAPRSSSEHDDELGRQADQLGARARALEPSVSAELGAVAASAGGRLAGFEHRLKEHDSILRKMRRVLDEHPGRSPSTVVLDDALRYTLEIDDSPPGHHAAVIRSALTRLERARHRVREVKNYWPRGDNYSGVNSVLIAPGGLPWELQFHTPESFRIKSRDHALYEELRADGTTPARKREIYAEMAAAWSAVPVPAHTLDPGALHPSERIILHQPP